MGSRNNVESVSRKKRKWVNFNRQLTLAAIALGVACMIPRHLLPELIAAVPQYEEPIGVSSSTIRWISTESTTGNETGVESENDLLHPFDGILSTRHPVWSEWYRNMLGNTTIRKWGCHRKETPLIFVHIGKAGGGMVRARFAASSLHYNRTEWHRPKTDNHFYPVSSQHNASFCNSLASNWRIPHSKLWPQTFEGNFPCTATTPIGLAIACPESRPIRGRCLGCVNVSDMHCHTVYVGHNEMGTELHWLPSKYLEMWWKGTPWSTDLPSVDFRVVHEDNTQWCPTQNVTRPRNGTQYYKFHDICSVPLASELDGRFNSYWSQKTAWATSHLVDVRSFSTSQMKFNYAPVYASLPVHRATIIREPFSWMISKFFWHQKHEQKASAGTPLRCDDIVTASQPLPNQGWAFEFCVSYIVYLCGNDCAIRLERGLITLEELEVQSAMNLRRSFSVVGLLNETSTFFEMLSTRISYVNMSMNPHVQGLRHRSSRNNETKRCKKVFADPAFQESFRAQLPLLGVVERLYNVAVEVNRFQIQELERCLDE